jgi:hypothetical protein
LSAVITEDKNSQTEEEEEETTRLMSWGDSLEAISTA